MHIRKNQLDIFAAACTFDASDTLAGSVFDHIEAIGADIEGICVLVRKVMGRCYRKNVARHVRRDGVYTCFDMPDGSILAVDFLQRPGSWLVAVESRTAWELCRDRDCSVLPYAMVAYEPVEVVSADFQAVG